jgi:hypothetical protein
MSIETKASKMKEEQTRCNYKSNIDDNGSRRELNYVRKMNYNPFVQVFWCLMINITTWTNDVC